MAAKKKKPAANQAKKDKYADQKGPKPQNKKKKGK